MPCCLVTFIIIFFRISRRTDLRSSIEPAAVALKRESREAQHIDLSSLQRPHKLVLTEVARRPFELTEAGLREEYERWDQKSQDMQACLWDRFQVIMLPVSKNAQLDRTATFQIFRQSVLRHVSIFYGDYMRAGGTAKRAFAIPECSEIGLGREENEISSTHLDSLAGSQGDIKFKRIPYYADKLKGAFLTDADGSVTMVTKYFTIREKKEDKKKQVSPKDKQRKAQKNKEKSQQNYLRELAALKALSHPNIVHGICTVGAKLQIVYPFLRGGDLVPLEEDKLGLRVARPGSRTMVSEVLNPDRTFMPRLMSHLISAVSHMHEKGFVHLDLKPENFMVAGPDRNFIRPAGSPELEAYHFILIDFGLSEVEKNLPDDCMKSGTEVTMAPEQILCNSPVGFGTDWWGVAAGAYRVRVFWEPSITEKERDHIMHLRDPQWGHVSLPPQPFFAPKFQDLMHVMLKPFPDEREFDKDVAKLLDMPYLNLGQAPAA